MPQSILIEHVPLHLHKIGQLLLKQIPQPIQLRDQPGTRQISKLDANRIPDSHAERIACVEHDCIDDVFDRNAVGGDQLICW